VFDHAADQNLVEPGVEFIRQIAIVAVDDLYRQVVTLAPFIPVLMAEFGAGSGYRNGVFVVCP
jgi:hypothetical protein